MIVDISSYQTQSGDKFLFDTNIWFYIYYSMGYKNEKKISKYSGFYKSILNKEIFITSQIVSEFINQCLRYDYNDINNNYKNFKDYRNSADGKKSMSIIKPVIINKILINCKKLNDTITINQLISMTEKSIEVDFNDILSVEQTKQEQLKIVTDDSDFGYFCNDFDILTYNQNLLKMY